MEGSTAVEYAVGKTIKIPRRRDIAMRRWKLRSLLAFVLAIEGFVLWDRVPPRVSWENVRLIKSGMARAKIERILGGPNAESRNLNRGVASSYVAHWHSKAAWVNVFTGAALAFKRLGFKTVVRRKATRPIAARSERYLRLMSVIQARRSASFPFVCETFDKLLEVHLPDVRIVYVWRTAGADFLAGLYARERKLDIDFVADRSAKVLCKVKADAIVVFDGGGKESDEQRAAAVRKIPELAVDVRRFVTPAR
jgi:hypothetical protein